MNSTLITSTSSTLETLEHSHKTASVQLIVFGMGRLNLALPIETVHKVINKTPIFSSGLNHVGVAHVSDREVTVVDLHQKLFKTNPSDQSELGRYLLITQYQGELFGIPVAETPLLMEVPLAKIRALPESYRRADTLEIASHVALIDQESNSSTIFLLDLERLVSHLSHAT
ncbi:MAG: chemotaxis protein CheW [Cyanothece sp. SIO1E1]|nr:chemotaxis protein CheW [Cyanothece sp. SIO1E1]